MDYSIFENVDELKKSEWYLQNVSLKETITDSVTNNIKESNIENIEENIEKITEEKLKNKTTETIVDKPEKIQVIYADLDKKPSCLFKNIIVFTNDRSHNNKTLENIREAIDVLPDDEKPNLYTFIAANCKTDDEGKTLYISDDKKELKISKQTNIDTLVFSRLGVQGEVYCEDAVKMLQDRGFLVLNPVRYSEVACNKLETAYLLEKANLPQPRFCAMNKKILDNEEMYNEALSRIFDGFNNNDKDKNEKKNVVVKILDGHGGTGVFITDCKRLIPILQAIFAIDPERELIIQRKEDGDGGDIRVHILTLRDKQIILGAMKREQLGGDFRSNVSLGAQAKPIKLTKEQEQIALMAAKVSKLPWAAVDIMPLVKGSNPEIGDNVILELNASPGTEGISEVLKHNFITILLNELSDPSEFVLQQKNAGYIEEVSVKFLDNFSKNFLAKLDTGNSTPASTLEVGDFEEDDDFIKFTIDGHDLKFKKKNELESRSPSGEVYKKPLIIVPQIRLWQRKLNNVPLTLVKTRDHKISNMLLNRDVISRMGYVVDPSKRHILTEEIDKVKILN